MTAVITKMAVTSSLGENEDEIHERIMKFNSGISTIDYFDTDEFMSSIAGNLNHETWEKVRKIAIDENVDNSSALTIYTVNKLLKNTRFNYQNVGLSLGTCNGGIQSMSDYFDDIDAGQSGKDNLKNYPLYKQMFDLSNYFGFEGPRFSFNSACAASSAAIAYASQMIESGKAKTVIAGGSDPMSKWVYAGFNALKTFNTQNATPYGNDYGLNLGEAATFFIIKDKEEALRDGDDILCEILGYGFSNDAHHPTVPDAEGNGISFAIREAIKSSGLESDQIFYINSHGTGTKANDVAELKGIEQVFGKNVPLISSLKGYMGHNLGAAASTELALTLIGLKNNVLYCNFPFQDYREETRNKKIFREHIDLSNQKTRDIIFINNNAAFGGHNSAVIFKTNLDNKYNTENSYKAIDEKSVYINYISESTTNELKNVNERIKLNPEKPLKEFDKLLYQRRMNQLSQVSIIAGISVFKDQTIPTRNGLIFGTPLGSMNATTKYSDSIRKDGFGKASGIYFPDLVVNSTSGRISRALNLKGYSASISSGGNEDFKSMEIAFEALKSNRADVILSGSGIESNSVTEKILGHPVKTDVVMIEMVNEFKPDTSILKVNEVRSYQVNATTRKIVKKTVDNATKQDKTKVLLIAPNKINNFISSKNVDFILEDGTGVQGIKALLDSIAKKWDRVLILELSINNELTVLDVNSLKNY